VREWLWYYLGRNKATIDASKRDRGFINTTKPPKPTRRSAWQTGGDAVENIRDIIEEIF